MSTSFIYGVPVTSDLPGNLLATVLEKHKSLFSHAFSSVKKWDMAVSIVHVYRAIGSKIRIDAYPDRSHMRSFLSKNEASFFLKICEECSEIYVELEHHPDVSCSLGDVDRVLSE